MHAAGCCCCRCDILLLLFFYFYSFLCSFLTRVGFGGFAARGYGRNFVDFGHHYFVMIGGFCDAMRMTSAYTRKYSVSTKRQKKLKKILHWHSNGDDSIRLILLVFFFSRRSPAIHTYPHRHTDNNIVNIAPISMLHKNPSFQKPYEWIVCVLLYIVAYSLLFLCVLCLALAE